LTTLVHITVQQAVRLIWWDGYEILLKWQIRATETQANLKI